MYHADHTLLPGFVYRLGRISFTTLIASLLFMLAACAPQPITVPPARETAQPPAVTVTPLASVSPVPLASVTPTPTDVPAPTPTPIALADAPAGNVEFALPLTVQHITETTATLFFELDTPVEGILLYWPADNPADQRWVALPPDETYHLIAINGLTPGVEYQAAVALGPDPETGLFRQALCRGQLWDPVSFRTASNREPLRVGVVGDSGFGGPETFALAGEMSTHNLDFVIHTGDVVYRVYENADPYEAYALKFYLPFAPLLHQMPIYPVVGNHDVEAATLWEGTPFYYRAFPPFADPRFEPSDQAGERRWYAFAYRDIQFVMLDTQAFFGEGGRAEQEAWLSDRLADPRFICTIVAFHVPPFTSGRHTSDGLSVQSWVPMLEASGVPLVLSGHDHNYERLVLNGITYVVSGGGSGVLYAQTTTLPGSVIFARQMNFVLLEIYSNRIDLTAFAPGGQVLDQATIPLE